MRRLVPDRLVMLRAPALEVTVHPSDVSLVGSKEAVARARAAVADRLTRTQAYLTASEEAQRVEDALRKLHDPADPTGRQEALDTLATIDDRLKTLTVPYEEWEVLYRQRLQVERDLLRLGTITPRHEPSALSRILERVGDLIG